jgi:branched-chain amino acid transport system permease protein
MIAAPISSVYPGMGRLGADHVLRGGGDRRHRFGARRADRRLLVGLVDTFGKVLLPQIAGMLVYMLMAAVLLYKPEGLFKQ